MEGSDRHASVLVPTRTASPSRQPNCGSSHASLLLSNMCSNNAMQMLEPDCPGSLEAAWSKPKCSTSVGRSSHQQRVCRSRSEVGRFACRKEVASSHPLPHRTNRSHTAAPGQPLRSPELWSTLDGAMETLLPEASSPSYRVAERVCGSTGDANGQQTH